MARRSGGTRLAQHDTALASLFGELLTELDESVLPASDDTGSSEGVLQPAADGSAAYAVDPLSVPAHSSPGLAHAAASRSVGPGLNEAHDRPLCSETQPHRSGAVDRPAWARQAFRALLFGVGPYRFAVPLVLLQRVDLLPQRLTRLPGQPAWHLGVFSQRGRVALLADLGGLMGFDPGDVSRRYMLVIGRGREALACEHIGAPVVVQPEQLVWVRRGANRDCMIGILADQLCGLLDVDALVERIRHG